MNYHNIKHDDMNNGSGLRVTLFVSGCSHHCNKCHNPETWSVDSGIPFDDNAISEILSELSNDYISGLTISGGDPLHYNNLDTILHLCQTVKLHYPNKSIWLYTGYKWEEIFPIIKTNELDLRRGFRQNIIKLCDVVVDGRFENDKANVNYHWAGSTNQRVINVKKSLSSNEIIKYID